MERNPDKSVEICMICYAPRSEGNVRPVDTDQPTLHGLMKDYGYHVTHGGCLPCMEKFYKNDREERLENNI